MIKTIALAAALSVAAFGCKKGGGSGDCASAVGGAIDRMMDEQMKGAPAEMTPEMKKQADEMMKTMVPKMKGALTKACTDDKWSADAIKCINETKKEEDLKKCESSLTKDQKDHADKAVAEAMGMGGGGGGGDKPPADKPPADKPPEGGDKPPADKPADPPAAAGSGEPAK